MGEANNNGEVDELTAKINERSERSIGPLLEDVAEWLSIYMNQKITSENFLDVLDNGEYLCNLGKKIQLHTEEYVSGKTKLISRGVKVKLKYLPRFEFQCHVKAKKETFFARENAAHFINWCKKIGIQDCTLFESDGLVLHKDLKNIVLTLLELARIASRYELDPIPSIIKLEKEIDDEETDAMRNVTIRRKRTYKPQDLDSQVQNFARKYKVHVEKVKDGKYIVNGKTNIFVRVLRNHIMVRVGGGWDELEHFLSRHNPKKIGRLLTSTPANFREV